MMYRGLIARAASALVTFATLAKIAHAQNPVLLVGHVRLIDSSDPSEIIIEGNYSGKPGVPQVPAGDIYVYPLPETQPTVRLTFGRPGYDFQYLVETPARVYATRVEDIVLTRIRIPAASPSKDDDGDTKWEVEELSNHLKTQADIAQNSGPAFVEIFQWNLAQYSVSLRDRPELQRELDSFSASPAYRRIASPAANPKIGVYRKVIEIRAGVSSNLTTGDALGLASDPKTSGPVRAAAVDALVRMKLSASEQSRLLSMLRNTSSITRSQSLLSSSFVGLAKLGTEADRKTVIATTASRSPTHVSAALSAIAITKVVDADSLTSVVIKTNPNPVVRAAVLDNVAQREPDAKTSAAQTKAISEVLNTDTSTAVKLRAIEALSTVSATKDTAASRQARRALEAVAADTTRPELRRAAMRATVRPR